MMEEMRKALAWRLGLPESQVVFVICAERADGLSEYWFLVGCTYYRYLGVAECEEATPSDDVIIASELMGVVALQYTYPKNKIVYCGYTMNTMKDKRTCYFRIGSWVVSISFPLNTKVTEKVPSCVKYPGE
jgi:hypothetical protein